MGKILALQAAVDPARESPAQNRAAVTTSPTISACCQAILAHFAIDPADTASREACNAAPGGLRIGEVGRTAGHLAMTLVLPMPYGRDEMTVSTIGRANVALPGLSLSPAIRAAAIGQPVGRLTGHPAFDDLDHLVVTAIEEHCDERGRRATILRFDDFAEPLFRARNRSTSRLLH